MGGGGRKSQKQTNEKKNGRKGCEEIFSPGKKSEGGGGLRGLTYLKKTLVGERKALKEETVGNRKVQSQRGFFPDLGGWG